MVEATVKEQILSDLERLSPEMQVRAAQLVHGLVEAAPKGTPGRDLLRFAGAIDAESIREMEEAIEDGCERIDPEAW
ncbi:MAG TPA: hypothetical protein VHR45_05150 [Thermoanaerobaculia bacterium]|nr:hypothetical protein [Thermoanaerobaculia bacterium]